MYIMSQKKTRAIPETAHTPDVKAIREYLASLSCRGPSGGFWRLGGWGDGSEPIT